MLNEVPSQKLKTLKVPTKEYRVVLISLLKRLVGPSGNGFEFLLGSQKLLILLQV